MQKTLLIYFLFIAFSIQAQRFETVARGSWSDTAVWANGNVPGYEIFDTLIVRHPVIFEENIYTHNYFLIEERGAICGHHNVTIDHPMDIFGFFRLDSLIIISTDVLYSSSDFSIASYLISLTGGGPGSFHAINHQGFAVGPWFECTDMMTLEVGAALPEDAFVLYPNPVVDVLQIGGDLTDIQIRLLDFNGKIILEEQATSYLNLSEFQAGVYYLQFSKNGTFIRSKKIIVAHE